MENPQLTSQVLERQSLGHEAFAERLAQRLDPWLIALGLMWLVAWTIEPIFERRTPAFARGLEVFEYVVWLVFIVEFVSRAIGEKHTPQFLKQRWWEIAILALPVLRLIRVVRAARLLRAARAVAAGFGTTRSAGKTLFGRVASILSLTAVISVVGGRLLFEFDQPREYGTALRHAALAALANEPFRGNSASGTVIEITLIAYAVMVFAAFAGAMGAFFLVGAEDQHLHQIRDGLERRRAQHHQAPETTLHPDHQHPSNTSHEADD